MFSPMAQGTVRVWSERAFFLGLSSLFGLDALPYHLSAMATMIASVVLLRSILARLGGSEALGVLAPLLWIANNAVAPAMTWASGYNQILCSFALLLCFRLRLAGRPVAEAAVLAMSFGALETAIVYPAIALAYELPRGRKRAASTIPLWALSAAFAVAHFAAAALPESGPYRLYWGSAPATFWTYWKMALGPSRLGLLGIPASAARSWLAAAFTVALVGYAIRAIRLKQGNAIVFVAWFLATLAPVLPLRDHVIDAYLTVPAIGLASLAAIAAVDAWRSGPFARIAAASLVAAYFAVSLPVGRVLAADIRDRSLRLRADLDTIAAATRGRAVGALYLKGASPEFAGAALAHRPMVLSGLPEPVLLDSGATVKDPGAIVVDLSGGRAK